MNILNKLNQADREKIEKKLKGVYCEYLGAVKNYNKKMEESMFDTEYQKILWGKIIEYANKIYAMERTLNILGIDYSDWAGNI